MTRRLISSSSAGIESISMRSFDADFVDEIDRLVGEESIGDVSVRQHGGRDQRSILDAHAMMHLVTLAKPTQDADRVLDGRLADHDGLEPPLERRILLDVLAVLVERRRADGVQLAAREHRLQHVRSVHRAFRRAGPDDGVKLVDEKNDFALGLHDLVQDRLQPILEFAAIFRAGDERAHVERDDFLVLQTLGHIFSDDAAGQAFDDRRLADAGLADEHRVVLRAPGQHLNHATDLFVPTDDRIELAAPGQLGQIAAVFLERLVFRFGILVGHPLRTAHLRQHLENAILRDVVLLKNPCRQPFCRLPRQCRAGGARC